MRVWMTILVLASSSAACAAEGLKDVLGQVARKRAVTVLQQQVFPVRHAEFDGTLRAVEPQKNMHVQITQFSVKNGEVVLALQTSGLFRLEGQLKNSASAQKITADLKLSVAPVMHARLEGDDGDLRIVPTIHDADLNIEIQNLTPEPPAVTKDLIQKALKAAYAARKSELLMAANSVIGERLQDCRLELGTAVRKALQGYNSQDTGWFSERQETKESAVGSLTYRARTWVWLDEPATSLKTSLKHITVEDDTISMGMLVTGKVKGLAKGKVTHVREISVAASAGVRLEVDASVVVQEGRFQQAKVSHLNGQLDGLRFGNIGPRFLNDLIQGSANRFLASKADNVKADLEQKLNELQIEF